MTALPTHEPGFEPMPLDDMRNLRNLSSPFPSTIPAGIAVVSYDDFEPSSVILYVDENDERLNPEPDDERDGFGLPVVILPTHVKPDGPGILGRRKKKRKAQVLTGAAARRPWWEVWEDHESVRRKLYDHRISQAERLILAAHDFKEGRVQVWPQPGSGVQNLWDQFKMYLGLPMDRKAMKSLIDNRFEYDDEDDDDGPGLDNIRDSNLYTSSSHILEFELGDPKTELFLADPEKSMKVFFSSHFRRQGNFYNVQHCLVFPKLIHFFLSYLIRSKVFPEHPTSSSLRAALSTTEVAERELPLTSDIANSFPDDVAKAFQALWGPRRTSPTEADQQDPEIAQDVDAQEKVHERTRKEVEEIEEKREMELVKMREEQVKADKAKLEKIRAREAAAAVEPVQVEEQAADDVDNGWGAAEPVKEAADGGWDDVDIGWGGEATGAGAGEGSSWGESTTTGGWGTTSDDSSWPSSDTNFSSWGTPSSEQVIDATTVSAWTRPGLLPLLGITALPITHRPGVVERSTRRIKEVIAPAARKVCKKTSGPNAEAVEDELTVKFARVVLEPWTNRADDPATSSSFASPTILPSSYGKVDLGALPTLGIEGHAPLRSTITVLVHPDSVPLLESAVGMGLGATWTQIKRRPVVDGKKASGKGVKDLWYMEELFQQVPSYWADVGGDE